MRAFAFRNPFHENPGLRVRAEKKIIVPEGLTSTKDIFSQIESMLESGHLSYEKTAKLMNDLAFVLIPFDKSSPEF
jgi:hypothetical protein